MLAPSGSSQESHSIQTMFPLLASTVGAASITLHPRPLFIHLQGSGTLTGVVLSPFWHHQAWLSQRCNRESKTTGSEARDCMGTCEVL